MKKGKIIEIVWFVLILGILIFSMVLIRGEQLEERIESYGIFAPLIIIILKMSTLIFAPLGGSPLYFMAGAFYGTLNGFIIVMIGDILGSIVCFFLARKYGNKVVRKLAGEKYYEKIQKVISLLSNTKSFIKARIGFMTMADIVAYAAGLSKINFWLFIFIHSLLFIPINLLYVYMGSRLVDLSAKYLFILPATTFILAFIGILFLYKDYEKQKNITSGL